MNLSQYTLLQLKQLSARITSAIEKQQSAGKASVLKKLKQLAREHGLSLEDVLADAAATPAPKSAAKPSSPRKAPLPAKYRHPNNRELGWSGRGRKPQWVAAWLANGGSMDALEVTAQKLAKRQPRSAETVEAVSESAAIEPSAAVTAHE